MGKHVSVGNGQTMFIHEGSQTCRAPAFGRIVSAVEDADRGKNQKCSNGGGRIVSPASRGAKAGQQPVAQVQSERRKYEQDVSVRCFFKAVNGEEGAKP